ncbi:hypothetical protein [Pseudomonas graminis]|uniref:hypothetical protein n=1 Tax=Pseudomonas graminis TaxID=158627 RepID=UPI003C22FCD5
MLLLGISLVNFDDLPGYFQGLAKARLPNEEAPGPFWAVFCNGSILGIYLLPEEAFTQMLRFKADLDAGVQPARQKIENVKTKTHMEKILAKGSSDNLGSSLDSN